MLKQISQLNKQQLNNLILLRRLCKKIDKNSPSLYPHIISKPRALPASLLFYQHKKLLGFLSVYFFYEKAVEIGLLIHPTHRKKGLAKQLIKTILPLIQMQHYEKVIFSSPSKLNDSWLLKKGFQFDHTEYYMERNNLSPILVHNPRLDFCLATLDDIETLCEIDALCFTRKKPGLMVRFKHILQEREHLIIIAKEKNEIVGKAHMRWDGDSVTLSDIAVFPTKQGKGLGKELITYCINHALSEGKSLINLDVETHNEKALGLYTQLGFIVQNACDYWTIGIKELMALVQA